jgi:hypothetical protein
MCRDDDVPLADRDLETPETLPPALGAEYRRQLLLLNRERIEFSFEKARRNGLEQPVILVLDLMDSRAACLSQKLGVPWEQIARCREQCRRDDVVPVQVIAAPPDAALCLVGPTTPNSPIGIAKPSPARTFRVVAIAAGGNSFADFPLPPVAGAAVNMEGP